MPIKIEDLKANNQDYLLVRWEEGQLVMEPACACGNFLDDDYNCKVCGRQCDCTFMACQDPQALSVAEKLIQGNPTFRNFKASLIVE